MNIIETEIPDLLIIEPPVFEDARGYFFEGYQQKRYAELGIGAHFVQDNIVSSQQNVLRGLHFQVQHPQGKLVQAIEGEIFDVVVDLRKTSATFGQWVGVILSEENHRQLYVPPGLAHGYYVRSESSLVTYKCTDFYNPQYERTLQWNDPTVGIDWDLLSDAPLLSEKDAQGILWNDIELFE